jgi:hypothetical protein
MIHEFLDQRRVDSPNEFAFLESLESRLLMSGNVGGNVIGTTLLIRGDVSSNHIVIDQSGLTAGQFRIAGLNGTKVNGQDQTVITKVTQNVYVLLGDGIDVLEMTSVAIAGNLTIIGGHSGDTYSLSGGSVGRNVNINAGQGDNTTTIDGTAIGGGLQVTAGWGVDAFSLTGNASVTGNVNFQPGYGENTCTVTQASTGSLTINGRGGPATVTVDHTQVHGALNLVCDSGPANILLEYSTFLGNMQTSTGKADDSIHIEDSVFQGKTLLSTGAGADKVSIEVDQDASAPHGTAFIGPTEILLGSGDDTILVDYNNFKQDVTFGHAVLDGGQGQDNAYWGAYASWNAGAPHSIQKESNVEHDEIQVTDDI